MAHSKTKKIEFLDQNVIFKKKSFQVFFLRRIDKTNVTVTPFYWKNPLVEDFSFRRKNMFALLKLWKAVEKKTYCVLPKFIAKPKWLELKVDPPSKWTAEHSS